MGCLSSKTDSSDQKSRATLTTDGQSTVPKLDSRLPFQQYRDFFQLKNYWKAVRRREDASKCLFFRLQQMQSQKQVNNVCTIRLLTVTKQRLVLIRYTEKNKDKAKMDGFVPMNNSEQ
ncbi:hypothetical protein T05_6639 [Trichinella murrelli]|uniref:Uncharacterized protein n=1 Tax=Trichinella murrelli TaxID=144512 RepID=A0A0V0U1B8_9BILA|nr:hypothetical protein T05_6639 [Trichinella murrelli]